jgi:hypothetical protein
MRGCRTVADVLATLAQGGEWKHRFVTMRFVENPRAWFELYDIHGKAP